MFTSIAAPVLVGLLAGVGALLVAMGIVGVPEMRLKRPNRAGMKNTNFNYPLIKMVSYPILAGVITQLALGWPVLSFGAAITAALVPRSSAQQKEQQEHFHMTEDLATWVQQVRDAIMSGSGLEQPLRMTAKTGPERLRPKLQKLANDLNTTTTEKALENFALNVKHHIADMLVSAYQIAAAESTKDLPDLMTAIARTAEGEVETFRSVEVSRKKVKSSVRMILGMLGGMAGGLLLFAREFLTYYDSPPGQMMLGVIMVLVVGSYAWIQKLNIVRRPPRFFALDDGTDEDAQEFAKEMVNAEAQAQDQQKAAAKAASVPRSMPGPASVPTVPSSGPAEPSAPPVVPASAPAQSMPASAQENRR